MQKLPAVLTLLLSICFAVAPLVTDPFSGFRADQLPVPQIDPPIQPAGYTFAIWGLIYGWLIFGAGFGLWKRASDSGWNKARWPLIISLAIGVPWLAIANTSAVWATITIGLMALFAILALIMAPPFDRWQCQAPIAIYAGWLTAATWVSIGSTAAGYGLLFGPLGWAHAGIIGALAIGIMIYRTRPSAPEYGATLIWALIGIIAANNLSNPSVSALATAGIVVLLVMTYRFKQRGAF